MFPMNPAQSWATLLILLFVLAALIWVIHESIKVAENAQQRRAARQKAATPSTPRLYVLPDLVRAPQAAPYDWQTDGL